MAIILGTFHLHLGSRSCQIWYNTRCQKSKFLVVLKVKLVERKIYLEKLENLRDTPDIKVITGMRRSGKSVIVQQFINRIKQTEPLANVLFVDFTRLEFEELKDYRRLSSWAEENRREGVRNYLVIDEVQMCEKFEHAINSLHASQNFDIYLTGSNAFLLSSDLATLFTGRAS